jgi:copper homeostasis protein
MRPPLLEVIVASVEDACEAEQGGAGRLEIVRDLASGGLTPPLPLVSQIIKSVHIPVRVMVRETAAHEVRDTRVLARLRQAVRELGRLPIDGLVLGLIDGGRVDLPAVRSLLEDARSLRVTFHRAFELVTDAREGFAALATCAQIDRVLHSGGPGSWAERRTRLAALAAAAGPSLGIIAGGGLTLDGLARLRGTPGVNEFHVGRAAREPATPDGAVRAPLVAALARALSEPSA